MTAEAVSAAAQPDPARSPAGSHGRGRRQHGGPTSRSPGAPARKDAHPVRDDLVVTSLVTTARTGDQQAWDALVERYAPLIWSICRRHQLGDTDAGNVGQIVWLQLMDHLGDVRHPVALPGWLATTTRRECLRVLCATRGPQAARQTPDAESTAEDQTSTEQELLLAERHAALREAMADLPPCCRRLITLLIKDPPVPDAEISARLDIPIESIAPNRSRCLDKLRDHPAIAALINIEGRDRTP